jgi:hypothetical protein
MFTFWNYYVLKLLCLETITLSDAMLSDINVLSQCHFYPLFLEEGGWRSAPCDQEAGFNLFGSRYAKLLLAFYVKKH